MNSSNILDTIRNGDWKDSDIAAKKDNYSKEVMNEDDKLDNRYCTSSSLLIRLHQLRQYTLFE